jgi:hippurate hydrolase
VCESVAQLHQARIDLEIEEGTPPLVNRGPMVGVARAAAAAAIGPEYVRALTRSANMGGEDFSWYLQEVPGCYVRLGARIADATTYPAHSSRFQIDEEVLAAGAAWLAEVARQAGQELAEKGASSLRTGSAADEARGEAEAS